MRPKTSSIPISTNSMLDKPNIRAHNECTRVRTFFPALPEVKSGRTRPTRQNPKPHTRFRPDWRPANTYPAWSQRSQRQHPHAGRPAHLPLRPIPSEVRDVASCPAGALYVEPFSGQNPCVTPSAVGLTTTTENHLWQAPNSNQQRDRKTQQQQPSAPTEMPRARQHSPRPDTHRQIDARGDPAIRCPNNDSSAAD